MRRISSRHTSGLWVSVGKICNLLVFSVFQHNKLYILFVCSMITINEAICLNGLEPLKVWLYDTILTCRSVCG